MTKNQKGFSQILLLGILFIGIVAGVYLVQQTQIFKPKAASGPLTINSSQTACSTTQTGMQTISTSWTGGDNANAYGVTLYQKGSNIRNNVGFDCLPASTSSYSFKGQFPINSEYEVVVVAYDLNNNNCQVRSMTAATKSVVNQTSCIIPGSTDCNSSAVLNKTFNMYTQKKCTPITNPKCVKNVLGQDVAVYECKADDGTCIEQIRPASEAWRCPSPSNPDNSNSE